MNTRPRRLLAILALLPTLPLPAQTPGAALPATAAAPRVELFSPRGTAQQVRQVTARFSAPMVALGDPRLPDPFTIACPATGAGRWADGRNWVYDFDADLPAGVVCRFTLKPNLATLAAVPLSGTREFRFDTGGPAITRSLPREGWEQIDQDQIFLLKLAAPATTESIRANASCVVANIAERLPVEVLSGAEREQVLAQRRLLGYDYLRLLWKDGEESNVRVRNRAMEEDEAALVVLRCQRRLPPGAQLSLNWGAGIATTTGLTTTQDQQLVFRVRPAFTAQVECTRTNARSGCIPVQPIEVSFSAPIARAQALAIRIKGKGITLTPKAADDNAPTLTGVRFDAPLPESSTLTVVLPPNVVDDAGRPLENAARFPLSVTVDAYPPLAKFAADFGILELQQGGVLPVTLRNVEASVAATQAALPARMLRLDADPKRIADWLMRVEKANESKGEWVAATPEDRAALKPKLEDQQEEDEEGGKPGRVWREATGTESVFAAADQTTSFSVAKSVGSQPAEVVGIPLKKAGFYVVELQSEALGRALLGRDQKRYVTAAALVTDMAVHLEWGREASRVWVTRLSDGKPVADAQVVITDYCDGDTLWSGRTDGDGLAAPGAQLGAPQGGSTCNQWAPHPLLAVAKKGDDFTFTQSGWNEGITPYLFGVPTASEREANIWHTVLDRALFRAGETVSMKHFQRRHVLDGMTIPAGARHALAVTIVHAGSGQRYKLSASAGADGIAENQWKIPAEAKLGMYSVLIDDHFSGQFRVEEFRLPSMRGSVIGSAQPLVQPKQAALDLHVAYLSGGGAANLAVKLRTLVEPRTVSFADYEDYRFGGAPVQEGLTTSGGGEADFDFDNPAETDTTRTQILPVTLDAAGAARVTVGDLPALSGPAQLTAELEYADANGEILTTTGHVRLVPAALNVGIRSEGWVASPEQLRFRVLVLDLAGKPVAKQAVAAKLYQSSSYSYRKRLIGGFYAYESTREVKPLATQCTGVTDAQGLLSCEVAPGISGQVIVRAETRDAQGNVAGATTSMWLAGKDAWWFGGTSGDRMDVLPEKKEYQAGETARFQVRMPFREATVLVSVEREGVLRSFVTRLRGEAPVVEVPITASDSPNVFVSVLAVRGRIPAPRGAKAQGERITALVDLDKPAYRLGVAQIKVGWRPHQLDVRVQPEQDTYRIGATVPTRIHVTTASGAALPAGTEVAVAAVDEALLDLADNPSWDLLSAMMGQRGLEVWTSTAQMQVVGKRHYGRKAVPHGGGGGREADRAREQFDSLLLWRSRVVVDANGDASVNVPLNDSLSSFRIVAVAHGGAQLFGTGSATIRTTQDLILTSGLPPVVREGDQYAATFTVRNTTDHTQNLQVSAVVSPALGAPLAMQQLQLPAGQSRDLSWQITVPVDRTRLSWDVTASEVGGAGRDRLKVSEQVSAAFPVRTYQATIAQLTAPLTIPAAVPKGAIANRGGLEVTLQAKLADNLAGVREYMSGYPYICLEQQLSQAIALQDRAAWDGLMKRLPAWMDRDGLLKYFPGEALQGDDTLTAYVLSIANEAGWPLLDADRETLTNALTRFVNGRIVRGSALPTADLTLRKLAAIAALSRYGAAQTSMLDSLTIEPNLWPTSAVLDWVDILQRTPGIPKSAEKLDAAFGILRARLNFQGTTMGFSTERSDALWWLMISTDSNANRLLLAVLERPEWREDMPRVVRGALGRQRAGHWNTTVANAWGVLAMQKFSTAFESTPISGLSSVSYGGTRKDVSWPKGTGSANVKLPWNSAASATPGSATASPATLQVSHAGTGAPWATVRATAALPLDKPLSTGFRIQRTITPVEQRTAGVWTRGDVARVRLDLEAQSDMSWVVVDDPVPAGATLLGSGLGGQSALLTRNEQRSGVAWLAFEERRFDGLRAYYRFVPKGKWTVEYTVRLNNPGRFVLPATRVEAMYAPEMLGELPNAPLSVGTLP
ncbi:MAG: MG2 domain-containing protein [Steroidobacteraceae bacterium]